MKLPSIIAERAGTLDLNLGLIEVSPELLMVSWLSVNRVFTTSGRLASNY